MDYCLNCNGAILQPHISYSYDGQICHCVNPHKMYSLQSNNYQIQNSFEMITLLQEIKELLFEIKNGK